LSAKELITMSAGQSHPQPLPPFEFDKAAYLGEVTTREALLLGELLSSMTPVGETLIFSHTHFCHTQFTSDHYPKEENEAEPAYRAPHASARRRDG
jgi:hypothetical protein